MTEHGIEIGHITPKVGDQFCHNFFRKFEKRKPEDKIKKYMDNFLEVGNTYIHFVTKYVSVFKRYEL